MPQPRWLRQKNKKKLPKDWSVVEDVLDALDQETKDQLKASNDGKRKTESLWPMYQLTWQKTRYIYDMHYKYGRIGKDTVDYCIKQQLIDGALLAKWKQPGYERLCSTYVINPSNYKFGTTSICRVPLKDRSEDQKTAQDPTTGCRGCASGRNGAGYRNIFGNKYGQSLAAVQIAREERQRASREEIASAQRLQQQQVKRQRDDDDEEEEETDDEEDDYGPSPAAGVWAGSKSLQRAAIRVDKDQNDDRYDDDDETTDDDDDDDDEEDAGPMPAAPSPTITDVVPQSKRQRVE